MSDDKWIKKAVNPAHKGYCTPMTKKTCTPRRKALARRFKSGDLSQEDMQQVMAQADKLLEAVESTVPNSALDSEELRSLIRQFVMAGYELETAKEMAYQKLYHDPNVVTPPKASFYPSDGGSAGGGGGLTTA